MDPKGERIIKSNNTIIEVTMNVVSTKSDIAICKKHKHTDQEAEWETHNSINIYLYANQTL